MIDTTAAKWGLSETEQYVIKWFEENGFDGKLEKQYISKTRFTISKDGVTDHVELVQGITNMDVVAYMEQYRKSFELLCELHQLRQLKNERGNE